MKTLAIAHGGTLISFLSIEAISFGVLARSFCQRQLGDIMLPLPILEVATVFCLFFAFAIVALAVRPGLDVGSIWTRTRSALALAANGTYDMANLSPLNGWPVPLAIKDLMWESPDDYSQRVWLRCGPAFRVT